MTFGEARRIRIGGGLGYWGDDTSAPGRLVRDGDLDYLVMDFLAEVTMSILQKQKQRDPALGYAADVVGILRDVLPEAVRRGVKIVCNAGGVNPIACADRVRQVADELGLGDAVTVAAIVGDDLLGRVDELHTQGLTFANLETGADFDAIKGRLACANAYIGATSVRDALAAGANIVLGGRIADPSLTLGPLMFEHAWADSDWDRLAAGIIAGHLVECGAHSTGGNHQDWQKVEGLEDVGFPIVEVAAEGEILMTKCPGTGGRVSRETVVEQLLYEIGDPTTYLTPDVTVDFTTLDVEELADGAVRVSGATGRAAPGTLKVSAAYSDGYSGNTLYLYSAPDALARARRAGEILDFRIGRLGLALTETRTDFIGAGAVHEGRTPHTADEPCEVVLRYAVKADTAEAVRRAFAEASTIFHGPPGKTNLISGRPKVTEVLSYWPTLVSREAVVPEVVIL